MTESAQPAKPERPETPEETVARIEMIQAENRTKAQNSALARARNAAIQNERVRRKGGTESTSDPARVRTREIEPCPDPFAPDSSKRLYAAWYRRLWDMAHDAQLTNLDIKAGFDAARMAAGVGKEAPPAETFSLDMDSMLGGSPSDENGSSDESPQGT